MAASDSPRSISRSACAVTDRLISQTAARIDDTASTALARKMRLLSERSNRVTANLGPSVKSTPTSSPAAGTVTLLDSPLADSFQTLTV